jgi:indolepyruvate ferredoxin oxidoreductase beta subunit
MKKDIAIAGVGGQGNLFATKILCQYAMDRGLEVLGTETIGAAQRGGSVVSHMRISDKPIYSPLIPKGSADVLIGMESLELLRHLSILNPKGYYIMNKYSVPTMFTNIGLERYPATDDIIAAAKKAADHGAEIEATYKAAELGNAQMTNVIMVGALAKMDGFFDKDGIRGLVAQFSPPRFREKNLEGFDAGYDLV